MLVMKDSLMSSGIQRKTFILSNENLENWLNIDIERASRMQQTCGMASYRKTSTAILANKSTLLLPRILACPGIERFHIEPTLLRACRQSLTELDELQLANL